ncbi:MAG: amino acid adenylation domain protein, partial [Ilumatobacteraceae bacterium]|nr:amino acid adenylation domain protein [Ilumatobacteraceae bacterium]
QLADEPEVLRITGVRDDRLVREAALVGALAGGGEGADPTVADLREAVRGVAPGLRPGDFATLDPRYRATSSWSAADVDRFDVVLRSRAHPTVDPIRTVAPAPWGTFTNRPARPGSGDLGPQLRAHLRATLPDHMVPSAFVVLDALPRTPNGKTDRAALPAPDRARREEGGAAVAPGTDLERSIAEVWQDILALDSVGVATNLFDLGANSLMMVQASARLGDVLGRRLSLVEMFGHPTIRALAAHIGADGNAGADTRSSQQGQDRAKARMKAMHRQREARRPGRPR